LGYWDIKRLRDWGGVFQFSVFSFQFSEGKRGRGEEGEREGEEGMALGKRRHGGSGIGLNRR